MTLLCLPAVGVPWKIYSGNGVGFHLVKLEGIREHGLIVHMVARMPVHLGLGYYGCASACAYWLQLKRSEAGLPPSADLMERLGSRHCHCSVVIRWFQQADPGMHAVSSFVTYWVGLSAPRLVLIGRIRVYLASQILDHLLLNILLHCYCLLSRHNPCR